MLAADEHRPRRRRKLSLGKVVLTCFAVVLLLLLSLCVAVSRHEENSRAFWRQPVAPMSLEADIIKLVGTVTFDAINQTAEIQIDDVLARRFAGRPNQVCVVGEYGGKTHLPQWVQSEDMIGFLDNTDTMFLIMIGDGQSHEIIRSNKLNGAAARMWTLGTFSTCKDQARGAIKICLKKSTADLGQMTIGYVEEGCP